MGKGHKNSKDLYVFDIMSCIIMGSLNFVALLRWWSFHRKHGQFLLVHSSMAYCCYHSHLFVECIVWTKSIDGQFGSWTRGIPRQIRLPIWRVPLSFWIFIVDWYHWLMAADKYRDQLCCIDCSSKLPILLHLFYVASAANCGWLLWFNDDVIAPHTYSIPIEYWGL